MKNSGWLVGTIPAAIGMFVATGSVLAGDEKPAASAEAGKPAPAFTLKNHDGKDVSLKDLAGKVVVLEWFNNECPYIVARHDPEHRNIEAETMKQFAGKPVVWLAIDSTQSHTPETIKKVAADWKLSFPILADTDGTVGRAYGAKTTPHMFVIDQKGNVAYQGAFDDDREGDKGSAAKNYVAAAVNAVLNNSTVETTSTKPYGCSIKYAAK